MAINDIKERKFNVAGAVSGITGSLLFKGYIALSNGNVRKAFAAFETLYYANCHQFTDESEKKDLEEFIDTIRELLANNKETYDPQLNIKYERLKVLSTNQASIELRKFIKLLNKTMDKYKLLNPEIDDHTTFY